MGGFFSYLTTDCELSVSCCCCDAHASTGPGPPSPAHCGQRCDRGTLLFCCATALLSPDDGIPTTSADPEDIAAISRAIAPAREPADGVSEVVNGREGDADRSRTPGGGSAGPTHGVHGAESALRKSSWASTGGAAKGPRGREEEDAEGEGCVVGEAAQRRCRRASIS